MPAQPHEQPSLRAELREYYAPLLPFFERSLAGRGDRELWCRLAQEHEGRDVLELGAGTGRITRVLTGPARRTVALDLNLEMLARARDRLATCGAVRFLVADMRDFRLDASFHLVAAANDPFSHLRSDRGRDRALACAARHLAPGGHFVLDALWLPPGERERAAREEGRRVEHVAGGETDGEEPLVTRALWRCDPVTHVCSIRQEYVREDEVLARTQFRGRYWTRDELEERLERAGLAVASLWGTYERDPWEPDSPHMVVRAVRA